MPAERIPVTCRPARPADTSDVMELTRTIWEGHDYVPHVWSDWLADPEGLLAVAEYEGRVLGLGKLTRITAQDWWLEGLRTHPEYEGRGIASSLHNYLLGLWERTIGSSVLRFATASYRLPVQRLAERTGFHRTGELVPHRAPARKDPAAAGRFRPIKPEEAQAALEQARAGFTADAVWDLMDLGWQWACPHMEALMDSIHSGRAWWWQDQHLLLGIEDEDDDDGHRILMVQMLTCPASEAAGCLHDFRALAGALDYPEAGWAAPAQSTLLAALQQAGFTRSWDASILIYARSKDE